jgi:superfamily II DNA or RNA helicase
LGLTQYLYGRKGTYRTGCVPGFDPSHELDFIAAWNTNATTSSELRKYEGILHRQFAHYRMIRSTGNPTEWFQFPVGVDPIAAISSFIRSLCPWITSQIDLESIRPKKHKQLYLNTIYHKNIEYCEEECERITLLEKEQAPVIEAIKSFLASSNVAGTIIAPCGSGKTRMTCDAIKGLQRVIICCPLQQIQTQWNETLLSQKVFTKEEIKLIGGKGTTDPTEIATWMKQSSYCFLTTYASSHLLTDALSTHVQVIILDEAHHMAGVIATAETGEGKTRRLMKKAVDIDIKRLSLTFTPRNIIAEEASSVLTMDDEAIFGPVLHEIKLRTLIKQGILPDYRIWSLRSDTGAGLEAKAKTILEAWNAVEEVNDTEINILHHLIVFTHTNEEANLVATFLRKELEIIEKDFKKNSEEEYKTQIFHVGSVAGCDNYDISIANYKRAKRSILINCKMLGEGVDLPITNGVAILYPKHAVGDIVQSIFRAGRWHKEKPLFHVILPILGEEDMSGLEHVFLSLAQYDEALKDEITYKVAHPPADPSEPVIPRTDSSGSVLPDTIVMEGFDGSKLEEVIRCFRNIRTYFYHEKVLSIGEVIAICKKYSISTSEQYKTIRDTKEPHLPEHPLRGGISWYTFLHGSEGSMTKEQFIKDIIVEKKIRTVAEWITHHTSSYPSSLNIADGYFGGIDEFQQLVQLASIRSRR